ncbi:Hypothetical predicted protein, partial [Lynx pardinus]
MKPAASIGGSFLLSPVTSPQWTFFTDMFLTLKPTVSPGRASLKASWCTSTDLTGAKVSITRFKNTSLYLAHRESTNTTKFVDILEVQNQGLVSWMRWWHNAIQSFKQCDSTGIANFMGDFLSLEPRHVSTWLQPVVTIPIRNWHKCHCVRIVANFLNCVNQKGMLIGLPILGDTCFKFTNTSTNNQDSTVSLRYACNHVSDKVSVSWGINDGHIILAGLKFTQGDINGDITFTFSFQLIQDPGILKEVFSHLSSLLLTFFDSSFVDPTTFTDQMTSSITFAQIYVSNDNDVDISLFLSHFGLVLV